MDIGASELRELEDFAHGDIHVAICIEAILQRVVVGKPTVERAVGSKGHEVSDAMADRWTCFALKALRHILTVGVFAWAVVRRAGEQWPCVLDLGTYSILCERAFPLELRLGEAPRGAHLARGFGYDPAPDGTLRSLVAIARGMCKYASQLRRNSNLMDKRRLRPRLFAEM